MPNAQDFVNEYDLLDAAERQWVRDNPDATLEEFSAQRHTFRCKLHEFRQSVPGGDPPSEPPPPPPAP